MINQKYLILLIICCFSLILFTKCTHKNNSTTIYLVRHAEKDTTNKGEDPPLIMEGYERAIRIVDLLGEVPFASIWSTPYQRNINTVQPLAKKQKLTIQHYEWYNWYEEVNQLKNESGNHLICGHGDNLIPMIVFLNGASPIAELGHHDYSTIFKLEITPDTCIVEWIKF